MTTTSFLRRATWLSLVLALSLSAGRVWDPLTGIREASFAQETLESLSRAEFSKLIRDLSEEDGYFRSDNFTSNETSYLHVLDRMREIGIPGGAYVGVGPEQNFTYIAAVRPRIAFIVDIRRQAMLQHLLYKALFHTSESPAEFLSGLLSRPLREDGASLKGASIDRVLEYLASSPAPKETFAANLARVRQMIREEFQVPLSEHDQQRLEYVYSAFHEQGLEIAFRTSGMGWGNDFRRFPNLRDLILEQDLNGKLGNFLANEEDYRFVRNLHLKNRIIPVVGDFAGPKALASIGDYLSKHGYRVSAFYTSNVEQFLFQNGVFPAFVENVARLPIDRDSLFIRAVPMRRELHPAQIPGHRITTLLQKISVFLEDYKEGAYPDYRSLATTHFIASQ